VKRIEEHYKYYTPRSKYIYDLKGIHKTSGKPKRDMYKYLFLNWERLIKGEDKE
jgi:hypothetical protein